MRAGQAGHEDVEQDQVDAELAGGFGGAERADVYLGPVVITLFTRAIYEDAADLPAEGFLHPALFTDDLDAECERLRALGVPFRSPGPVTTTSGPNRGGKGIYVEDPDGNGVEIIQLARPWGPEQDAGLGSDA